MIAGLALAAAVAVAPTGTIQFHGAVIQGQAGGITGVDVPAHRRRTTTTFGVTITIGQPSDPRTEPPKVMVQPGGDGVVVTTVYF